VRKNGTGMQVHKAGSGPGARIRDPNPAKPDLYKGLGRVSGAVTLLIIPSPIPVGECPGIPGPVPVFSGIIASVFRGMREKGYNRG
jgi:hypothetical protein